MVIKKHQSQADETKLPQNIGQDYVQVKLEICEMYFSIHLAGLKCNLYFIVEIPDKMPSLSPLKEASKQTFQGEITN